VQYVTPIKCPISTDFVLFTSMYTALSVQDYLYIAKLVLVLLLEISILFLQGSPQGTTYSGVFIAFVI
jgi:hypothetical protein